MSDSARARSSRGLRRMLALGLSLVLASGLALGQGLVAASTATAAEQPQTPQQVADYFDDGLIPRLIDLFGAGDGVTSGVDFDASTEVGAISRVSEWTADFLEGKQTDTPTQLTNQWVAPVSVREAVLGLALVWINPATDEPELADFFPRELAADITRAPKDSLLVHQQDALEWFAIDGDTLTPLVVAPGGSLAETTPAAYQRTLKVEEPEAESGPPQGVLIAAIVLGLVVVALTVFVLMPVRRRKGEEVSESDGKEPDDKEPDDNEPDDNEPDDTEPDDTESDEAEPEEAEQGDAVSTDADPEPDLPVKAKRP